MGNIYNYLKKAYEKKMLAVYLRDYPKIFSKKIISEFSNIDLKANEVMKYIPEIGLVKYENDFLERNKMSEEMASASLAIDFIKQGKEIERTNLEESDWFYKTEYMIESNEESEKHQRQYCFSKKEFSLSVFYHDLKNKMEILKMDHLEIRNIEMIEQKIEAIELIKSKTEKTKQKFEEIIASYELKKNQLIEQLKMIENNHSSNKEEQTIIYEIKDKEKSIEEMSAHKKVISKQIENYIELLNKNETIKKELLDKLDISAKQRWIFLKESAEIIEKEIQQEREIYRQISCCYKLAIKIDDKEGIRRNKEKISSYNHSYDSKEKDKCYIYKK